MLYALSTTSINIYSCHVTADGITHNEQLLSKHNKVSVVLIIKAFILLTITSTSLTIQYNANVVNLLTTLSQFSNINNCISICINIFQIPNNLLHEPCLVGSESFISLDSMSNSSTRLVLLSKMPCQRQI